MPSLKDFRNRIVSVKSTRKITSAMKMVAASKLRRAQQQAEASQPYAARMAAMLSRLAGGTDASETSSILLNGTGKDDVQLLVVVTSDRGLCGGFNSQIARLARHKAQALKGAGKTVKILCVGRKGRDALKKDFGAEIVHTFEGLGRKRLSFADAQLVADKILELANGGAFDVCTVVYNAFRSVIKQEPSAQQLIPLPLPEAQDTGGQALFIFEPSQAEILESLLPRNLAVQVYRAMLDSAAGEQAARMTAMDNSTRNAGDMINKLTVRYNRARQAYITKELIEIISGAEAV
jgi:F-type H+-transporting ATPase subunit gamma